MNDRIFISNLCIHGYHGAFPEEAKLGQKFFIDINCHIDPDESSLNDDYSKTVCYAKLCELASEVSASGPFKLIETLGDHIATRILATFPTILEVRVQIRKPSAPLEAIIDHVGVEITRTRKIPIGFSLGSNIGEKADNIRTALARLDIEPGIQINKISHFYKTAPWGIKNQDWFINSCAMGYTNLSPHELLRICKKVEIQMGRIPNIRWGPRLIDIDILFYGDRKIDTDQLTLPHPEIWNRPFILIPLAEIMDNQSIVGRTVNEAVSNLSFPPDDVIRMKQSD